MFKKSPLWGHHIYVQAVWERLSLGNPNVNGNLQKQYANILDVDEVGAFMKYRQENKSKTYASRWSSGLFTLRRMHWTLVGEPMTWSI